MKKFNKELIINLFGVIIFFATTVVFISILKDIILAVSKIR
jgi:hypothetical protein